MKQYLRLLAVASTLVFTGQACALEATIERAGMVYTNIPLTTKFMRSNETAIGIRFGQTRFSTDKYGSLLNAFTNHPAMVEVEFRPTGRIGDISFRLQEFKLNGISSLEKQSITGGLGFVVLPATAAIMAGVGSVAAVGVIVATSGEDDDDDDEKSSDSQETSSSSDDGLNHDSDDDDDHLAGHDDDDDGDDGDDEHEDNDDDDDHDDVAGHDDDDDDEDHVEVEDEHEGESVS
jgi:hypothetical protein